MSFRFASLGSGSKGNGTIIDNGETCLLIDLGFNLKETLRRLARLNLDPKNIDAILVTHEHADHFHGVPAFARKFETPVYLTHGTYRPEDMGLLPNLIRIDCHETFQIETFVIVPVAVPHDAKEPCQYVINSKELTIGILTDLGHVTPHVRECYQDCDALLLECNHDLKMLYGGSYPSILKKRVGGQYGHLNNEQAADFIGSVNLQRLSKLVISHISQQNNQPHLALAALNRHLQDWPGELFVATQEEGVSWIQIGD